MKFCCSLFLFRASPRGEDWCVSIYTGEGCHLGGIIGIPWSGSEAGFGVHVAVIRSFFVFFFFKETVKSKNSLLLETMEYSLFLEMTRQWSNGLWT